MLIFILYSIKSANSEGHMKEYNNLIKVDREKELIWQEVAKQVAHEIRTPLSSMKLNIQHLQRIANREGKVELSKMDKIGKALVQQIDNLANIATVFSHYAELPKPYFELVCLNDICKNAFTTFAEHEHCSFNIDIPNSPIYAHVDRHYLMRILNNLLKNAVQAIPMDRSGEIRLQLTDIPEKDTVQIRVFDNGRGISIDERDHIFEPHFTTKKSGTGLGLALTKNFVARMNGNIHFQTSINEGTVFIVELPINHG